MAFSGLRGASSGLLAVLRKGPRLRRRKPHTAPAPQSEPAPSPIASLAGLNQIVSGYLGPRDIERIREAYRFADNAHLGQFRASGEPYISHPIAVTEICAGWKLDADSLMAALLHDVIEDQNVSKQELAEKFGVEVAEIVDGLTKLERLEYATKAEQQAESFRKMLLAMARDVRVILIKLADRLHNMRTLDAVNPEKRRRVARETLDIYTPIAHRLGLNALFRELQDRCFKAIHPNRYAVLHKAMMAARGNRREVVSKIAEAVRAALPAAGLDAEVSGREKSLYGIYKKMVEQKKSFSDVLDIYGFRIIVHTLPECYLAMGTLHQLYRPVPGKFKDYIAIPKINGYQSLHTTLIGPYGTPVEFQFRTRDMDHVAEEGVASHWLYKEQGTSLNDLQKRTHQWLQSLLDIQSQTGDSGEFLEHVKVDLFPDAVYVFTPQGKILSLPRGATPVDFAYAIHTDVGNHAVACKINGEFSPLRTELHSGDAVEIVTSAASRPSAQWLNYVRTGRARSEIRHYLRNERYEESVAFGRRLLNQAFDQLSIPYPKDDDPQWERLAKGSGGASRTEILVRPGKRHAGNHRDGGGRIHVRHQRAHRDPRQRGPGGPAGPLLRPAAGRRDHRRHPPRPRAGGAHDRLSRGQTPAGARAGTLDPGDLGHHHGPAPDHAPGTDRPERTRRAGPPGGGDHRSRLQHHPAHHARRGRLHGPAEHHGPGRQPQPPGPGHPRHPARPPSPKNRARERMRPD